MGGGATTSIFYAFYAALLAGLLASGVFSDPVARGLFTASFVLALVCAVRS